jgi:hypothetical protein
MYINKITVVTTVKNKNTVISFTVFITTYVLIFSDT